MTYTAPFLAIAGQPITSAGWNESARDNLNHLRGLLPDPTTPGYALIATSTTAAAFNQLTSTGLASDSVSEAKLDCLDTPSNDEVLTYDSATGRFEWQGISALASGVPTGMIAAFQTAASIPSGWAGCDGSGGRPNLTGRLPVGAGTVFSTTWTENTAYGSDWGHAHTMQSHTHTTSGTHVHAQTIHAHSSGTLSVSGSTTGGGVEAVEDGTSEDVAQNGHQHDFSSGVANATANSAAVDTGATASGVTGGPSVADASTQAWTIPSYAVVFAIKQ